MPTRTITFVNDTASSNPSGDISHAKGTNLSVTFQAGAGVSEVQTVTLSPTDGTTTSFGGTVTKSGNNVIVTDSTSPSQTLTYEFYVIFKDTNNNVHTLDPKWRDDP